MAGMKSFFFHLWVLFSPKINTEVLEDKYPGRKPPSVMPKPPIDPPKYVADYPDVDEMYKRFLAAKKDASSKPKKTRRGKRLFD